MSVCTGKNFLRRPSMPERIPDDAINSIMAAVESGDISESRIDESVLCILRLKEIRGIL